jgi:hypothetical protein
MKCKRCQRNLGFRLIILGMFYSVTLIAVVLDTDISLKAVVLIAFWAVWAELGACPVRIYEYALKYMYMYMYISDIDTHTCVQYIYMKVYMNLCMNRNV